MGKEIIKVSEFTIEAVHKKAVTPFIEKWHYSHYAGGIQHNLRNSQHLKGFIGLYFAAVAFIDGRAYIIAPIIVIPSNNAKH